MHLLKRLLIFESLLVLAVCRETFVTQLRLSQSIKNFGHKEREEDEPKYVLMAKTVEGMETAAHAGIRASRRLEDAVPPDEEDNKSAKEDEKSADGGDGSSSDSADAKDKAVSGKATSSGSKKRKSKSHEPHVAKKSDEPGDKEGTEEQSGDDTSKPKVETTGQQEGGSTGASSSKDIKPKKTKVPKPAKVSKKASKKSNAEDIAAAEKAGSGSSDPEAAEVKNGDAPGSTDSNSQEEGSEEQNGDAAGASNSNSRDGHSVEDGKEEDSSPLDALDTIEKISFNSCQKIDFAVAYLTSLQFDGSFVASAKTDESNVDNVEFWSDVQYFQLMIIPASLLLAFFGSYLLFPASLLTAIGFGVFLVFHFVNGYFDGTLNCQVKLFLSVFSAGICATMAAKFVKFGLFTLGAVSTGIACYMFFDAFPAFDPGQNEFNGASATQADASSLESVMTMSDISPMAWIITIVLSLFTGVCIRVYEQGSVEVLTAAIGGVGTGYSMHSFILLHGGKLNRSLVFFVAGLIGFFGWRFQRLSRLRTVAQKPRGTLPQWKSTPPGGASWKQLQASIDSTNALLEQNGNDDVAIELAGLLDSFQENVKRGKGD